MPPQCVHDTLPIPHVHVQQRNKTALVFSGESLFIVKTGRQRDKPNEVKIRIEVNSTMASVKQY